MELSDKDTPKWNKELAKRLKLILQQELIASDAFVSMFVSALNENDETEGDMEILNLIKETPNLCRVLTELKLSDCAQEFVCSLNDSTIEWLHCLIVEGLTLRMLNSVEYVQLMASLDRQDRIKLKPLHIFEIESIQLNDKTESEIIRYGFYVGRLAEFYAIIKNGFIMHSCRRNNFDGEKLRLLPDLASAFNRLQYNASWCGSICGSQVGCIAFCSYINDPQFVHVECNASIDNTFIEDSDLVMPRFILFYGNRGTKSERISEPLQSIDNGLLQSTPSTQRIHMDCRKRNIQTDLAQGAIMALGHLVLPFCNQILP